jgi:hypothetical protein
MIPTKGNRQGVIFINHKGKDIPTTVGSRAFENSMNNFEFDIGWVPKGFEHRPDLISDVMFNTPAHWWVIMQANMITSPFEQLNAGDRILIPRK